MFFSLHILIPSYLIIISEVLGDSLSFIILNSQSKAYVVTPHKNRRDETILSRGHSICVCGQLTKFIEKYH